MTYFLAYIYTGRGNFYYELVKAGNRMQAETKIKRHLESKGESYITLDVTEPIT